MEVNPQRLRTFLAVADALHFGRAALRLHVAQPSVSQQVARLERDLGCRLFERRPGGVELTEAGRALVTTVGLALRQLDEAVDAFVLARRAGRPHLRIGTLSSLSDVLVPAVLAARANTGTGAEVVEGGLPMLVQRLRDSELDLVLCYGTGDPDALRGLQVDLIDARPVTVALRSGDPLAATTELPWQVLAGHPWILPSASRQYRDDMLRRFYSRGLRVDVVADATTLAGQLALVRSGVGLTFTSPWAPVPDELTTRPAGPPREQLELLAVRQGETDQELGDLVVALRAKVGGPEAVGR